MSKPAGINNMQFHVPQSNQSGNIEYQSKTVAGKIIAGTRASKEVSLERKPLPKIKIDSDPLSKPISSQTNKISLKHQERDSVNSTSVLDYNFENYNKNKALISTQKFDKEKFNLTNTITTATYNTVSNLSKSEHPTNVKMSNNSHVRGKSLAED